MSLKKHQSIKEVPLKDSSFQKIVGSASQMVHTKRLRTALQKNHRKVGGVKIYLFFLLFLFSKKALINKSMKSTKK